MKSFCFPGFVFVCWVAAFTAVSVSSSEAPSSSSTVMMVFIHGSSDPFFYSHEAAQEAYAGKKYSTLPLYARFCYLMREKIIFPGQPIQGVGLEPLDEGDVLHAPIVSRSCREQMQKLYGESKKLRLYSFGWSGQFSVVAREYAALQLYQDLLNEKARLEKLGEKVSIEILGHSHGGTLGLTLAKVDEHFSKDLIIGQHLTLGPDCQQPLTRSGLIIDKIIAFGMPIQSEADEYVHHPMFKAVYHVYSEGDFLQGKEFISTRGWYCSKTFAPPADGRVHPNIINLTISAQGASPSHFELGLVGYRSAAHYPSGLPFFPLPMSAFALIIAHAATPYLGLFNHADLSLVRTDNNLVVECSPKVSEDKIKLLQPSTSKHVYDLPVTFNTEPFEEKENKCWQSFYSAGRVWYLPEKE